MSHDPLTRCLIDKYFLLLLLLLLLLLICRCIVGRDRGA